MFKTVLSIAERTLGSRSKDEAAQLAATALSDEVVAIASRFPQSKIMLADAGNMVATMKRELAPSIFGINHAPYSSTGFAISERHIAMTAHNVTASEFQLFSTTGRSFSAKPIFRDDKLDLIVLEAEKRVRLDPLKLTRTAPDQQEAIASLGFPVNANGKTLHDRWKFVAGKFAGNSYIRPSNQIAGSNELVKENGAAIPMASQKVYVGMIHSGEGASGSPVFNTQREVIGMHTNSTDVKITYKGKQAVTNLTTMTRATDIADVLLQVEQRQRSLFQSLKLFRQ